MQDLSFDSGRSQRGFGIGFLGGMTILSSVLRGFETVVLEPVGILFLFGLAAGLRLLAEVTPQQFAFSDDGLAANARFDRWESILGVAILRQEGEYIELYIDLIRGTIPRRFRRGYFAGYVVEGSTDVAGMVEQYGGREKLIVVQAKE